MACLPAQGLPREVYDVTNLFATLGLALGILGLLARFAHQDYQSWKHRKQSRTAFIRALFAEIDHNIWEMELFATNLPNLHEIQDKLTQEDYRPHIRFAPHTHVYRSNLQNLHYLDDSTMQFIINLYSRYDDIVLQCDGIALSSFKAIDVEGQVVVIDRILRTHEECLSIGKLIIAKLANQNKKLSLRRFKDRRWPIL